MRIQSTVNGGFAEVSDEYAQRLIAAGGWKRPRKPRTTKPKPAPKQEPATEE
ncbi:hypothetical protein SEA_LAKES_20 [Mycobacterium phage Lakes]|uniref:Gene 18 protein n=6 Tax=Mycobacterium phage D29 TaxID=28369 RepID=VG18_BPMD2|nr:head-tail connector protein [Mycobacterium phage D29]YP_008058288.1 head-tail connector protein [Mycobacterium phage Chy5]YP_008060174.1 head-tail connector protein [Mycobacterium phage Chy4]O64211.1 RecName: Full=Gene 18 protein; AltName: Full=Gp18 [Fromanvirus D29]AGK85781.1 hypothetical protein Chy1_0014 [Mycobacterium phage Chy1]AOQ27852.1 hypothetical protein SEA_POMAR16_20 [Mycobacterium phage Pomar16]APC43071.1 hypothetical protein SEA_KERBEROS_20 [Mycobacterium phage Kerberos]APC4